MAIIHQRVSDSCTAQAQREKRRRRVLVEQMKALHDQEVRENKLADTICQCNNYLCFF